MVVIKLIGVTRQVLGERSVVERVVETDAVHIHVVLVHVDHLKAAELVASGEYELTAVLVCEAVAGIIGGGGVMDRVVGASVLHYHGIELPLRVYHRETGVVDRHVYLLVGAV